MKPIGEAELKRHISSGEFLNTYIIFGTETYLKQHYVNQIIRKTTGGHADFNFVRMNGSIDTQALYDAVSQLPFMNEKRCVAVCDFDIEAARADLLERLYDIVAEQISTTVLIFWYDTVEVNPKRAPKLTKFVEHCEKNRGAAVRLDTKSDGELLKLLTKAAEKRGCRLETTSGRYLLEVCGHDLMTLQNEVEKLCAFAPGESITKEIIDKAAVRTVDASIYDLTKAINSGNGDKALRIISDLFFQKTEPIMILSVLSGCYVDMYRAKAAENSGVRPKEIAAEFGYRNRGFVLDNAAAAARKLTGTQLASCLSILLEADKLLKSARAFDKTAYAKTVLEQTVVRLMMCAAGGRA